MMVELNEKEAERLARLAPGKSLPLRESGWFDVYQLRDLWEYRDLGTVRKHAERLIRDGKMEKRFVRDPERATNINVYRSIED